MSPNERERQERIISAEIESYRKKYQSAQDRFAYGSASAERTMDKYSLLERALEHYLNTMDSRESSLQKLIEVSEAIRRAEMQIERMGEKSLTVHMVLAEIKRIVNGDGIHV